MQRQAKATGASELAVPATIQVVDKVPLLGSGKTDYVAATALAKELAAAPQPKRRPRKRWLRMSRRRKWRDRPPRRRELL